LAHVTTVVIPGSSSLLFVRNTRSPILGSSLSWVPSSPTSSRASASVTRPVWVSVRPLPTQPVNVRSCRTGSASAAAAVRRSSGGIRIASSQYLTWFHGGGAYGRCQAARTRSMLPCTMSRACARGTPAISSSS
jgi:hypothetical protein